MNENEEIEELDLFVWSDEDLAKPKEQSPSFDYKKSIGNNFTKIKGKFKSTDEELLKHAKAIDAKASTDVATTEKNGLMSKEDKQDITNIKAEQQTQNTDIENLQEDVENINEKDIAQDEKLETLEAENKYLRELNDSLQETVLDSETEASESLVVNTVKGIGKINLHGGERQETRTGINLINTRILQKVTKNGIDFIPNSDGSINISGTATADAGYSLRSGTLSAGTYTYKCFNATDIIGSNIYFAGAISGDVTKKISSDETKNHAIEIKIVSGTTINTTVRPMLVEGEYTEETFPDFEQFGVSPSVEFPSEVEIVGDNVNIFDKDNVTILSGYVSNAGKITTSSGDRMIVVSTDSNQTYTISKALQKTASKNRISVGTTSEYPTANVQCNNFKVNSGNAKTEETITAGENDKYLVAQIYNVDTETTLEEILDSIKVEKGTKATSYSKFGQGSVKISTSNEDNSIGNNYIMPIQQKMLENDNFIKKDGIWYEKHNWLEFTLDAKTLNKFMQQGTSDSEKYRYFMTLQDLVKQTDTTHAKGYCTHFPMTINAGTHMCHKGFAVSGTTNSNLYVYDEGETLEEFKVKIANEEVKFYLQLQEPVLLKCTSEQSKILGKIEIYKDCTIITTDNDLCKVSLKYKKDTDKEIKNLEQAIVALGGVI